MPYSTDRNWLATVINGEAIVQPLLFEFGIVPKFLKEYVLRELIRSLRRKLSKSPELPG